MGRKSHNGKYQQEDRDYLKKTKTLTQKTYMYLHVYCCAIYNSRDMETTFIPISGQMDKEHVVYIHNGICCCCRQLLLLLQSCPTPCDLIDGSPPGSPVPGILQAKTLEWVAISFSSE